MNERVSRGLVWLIIASIVICEYAIMLLLPQVHGITAGQAGLLDASILSLLSGTIVFLFAVLPLENKIKGYSETIIQLAIEHHHTANAMIAKASKYPRRSIVVMVLGIFIAQAMIMANLGEASYLSENAKPIVDAAVTCIVIIPLVFLTVVVPIEEQLKKLNILMDEERT